MQKEIENSLEILRSGKLLLYPTDTIWGIGCDATHPEAVQKVYQLKKRAESKALICLVSDLEMLKKYVASVPPSLITILNRQSRPTTVIYHQAQNVAQNLLAENQSLAIRICKEEFCNRLISEFGKPIVSTSANISGEPSPKSFAQISDEIKKGVDYIVNLPDKGKNTMPSKIIQLEDNGEIKIIRA